MRTVRKLASPVLAVALLSLSVPVLADPPAHAKAHGWRAKHVGHTGVEWDLDYGIASGTCDRKAVATVLGGITGGLIANRVADGDNRTIATLIGAAAGALIGNRIGRELDNADQACMGHALELSDRGQTVSWTNESTGVSYQVVPGADRERNGAACREFNLVAASGSNRSSSQGLACQSAAGVWQIVE
jgi:surface antigen